MPMSLILDILLNDLRALIRDLGQNGGLMSPSVYDTAQALRLYPTPNEDHVWPAVNWLVSQQHADGGWGNPAMPLSRAVPTLAAILALRHHCQRRSTFDGLLEAKRFLRRQLEYWEKPLPDNLPVGMELLLPYMLKEAYREEHADDADGIPIRLRLDIPLAPYRELIALGDHKRALIQQKKPRAGTAPVYSWEAWASHADPGLIDGSGGIGHSPAATAAWLFAANHNPSLHHEIAGAERYLRQASLATSESAPCIMPTAWPIPRFEQSFSLYALVTAGILDFPSIQDVLKPQIADLQQALKPKGIGFSDDFMPDGDDTAAAVAVLIAAGYPVDLEILRQFERDQCFVAYHGELQPSISLTARAVHALDLAGVDISRWWKIFIDAQKLDGSWSGDKWNTSWLYTTCHVLIALKNSPYKTAMKEAVAALQVHQHPDGGWGIIQRSTTVETAYAVLALQNLRAAGLLDNDDIRMLQRGYNWLCSHYRPFRMKEYQCWLNKEIYCPQRIDRAYELSAMLAVTLGELKL